MVTLRKLRSLSRMEQEGNSYTIYYQDRVLARLRLEFENLARIEFQPSILSLTTNEKFVCIELARQLYDTKGITSYYHDLTNEGTLMVFEMSNYKIATDTEKKLLTGSERVSQISGTLYYYGKV